MSENTTTTIKLLKTPTVMGRECLICEQKDPPYANLINGYNLCDECKQRLYNLLYKEETR